MKSLPLVLCCLGALFSSSASAHHNPRSTPIVTLEDAAYEIFVDYGSAQFEAYDAVGEWHALNLSVNLAPLPWLSIHATSGLTRAFYDSGFLKEALGVRTVSGGMDTSFDIGVRTWRGSDGKHSVSLGLGVELPTGDEEYRLGGGHYSLTGRLVYEAQFSDKFPVSAEVYVSGNIGETKVHPHLSQEADSHLHGAIIAPHSELLAGGRIGAAYKDHGGWVSANLLITGYLKKPEALGPVALRLGAGLNIGDEGFSLTGGVTVPFMGLLPNLWMSQVGIGYRFGVEPPDAGQVGCGCGS